MGAGGRRSRARRRGGAGGDDDDDAGDGTSGRIPVDAVEAMFVYAAVWAFGGGLAADKTTDYRAKFSNFWKSNFSSAVHFPKEGSVFDFFYDARRRELAAWAERVPEYVPAPIGSGAGEVLFNSIVVPTVDSVRMTALLDGLVRQRRGVMFVGGAGTGKTTLVRDYLRHLDEDTLSSVINMNYYTDSATLQAQLEAAIDKRSGRIYGPPATKRLIYYVDDLNMPYVEKYGTQNALALLRQHIDWGSFFDRSDLGFRKEVVSTQYITSMNPTAGSFLVNERLQRHFVTLAVQLPAEETLRGVYGAILGGHLAAFSSAVQALCEPVVKATIALLQHVAARFLPSAVKFVYNWNMRELSNIFQGLCSSAADFYRQPLMFVRLWLHESQRVLGDRLLQELEIERFGGMLVETSKRYFEEEQDKLHEQPLLFSYFANQTAATAEPMYLPVSDYATLRKTMAAALAEYNSTSKQVMDLVLFEEAMQHVCRIARILWRPAGNAMLVGVGGSGKQSLTRLAAYVSGFATRQIAVNAAYTEAAFREDLVKMHMEAGLKNGVVFLLTDSQVADERFLVYINDLLSSGWIPDLFSSDELDGVFNSLRSQAKAAGIPETRDTMTEFFLERVRANLHVVLAFSPVGDTFRSRARRFPALVNCTSIDWFHAWSKDALVSVAARFLGELELGSDDTRDNIAYHMAEVHLSVAETSKRFKATLGRHNYVTPKSYLELISFYKLLLADKRAAMTNKIERLDVGLSTLAHTAESVAELQDDLKMTLAKVEERKKATDALLEQMGKERGQAELKQEAATVERAKAAAASDTAAAIEEKAQEELAEARPALERAREAVSGLSKASLTELKNFPKAPKDVDLIVAAVLMMLEGEFNGKHHTWDRFKRLMKSVDAFKSRLESYDAESMEPRLVEALTPIYDNPAFQVSVMERRSMAASKLCDFVRNIFTYNRVFTRVKPLMQSLEDARRNKAEAEEALAAVEAVVAEVEARLKALQDSFMEATNEKAAVEASAARCKERLQLAERLVTGLSSENERWAAEVEKLREDEVTLVGDVLLGASFVSYIGAFSSSFRDDLWRHVWVPDLESREIPLTDGADPLTILSTEAQQARWMNEGLQADRISLENGSIICNSQRWPLLIDPQLQGITWLRSREEASAREHGRVLHVLQMTRKDWMRVIVNAIQNGSTVILENLGEELDAVLTPVLMRSLFRKGKHSYIKLGGEDVPYDPAFRLYLQTKMVNPHYRPEVFAQCSVINFIVTEGGLGDQLLHKTVEVEAEELERQKEVLAEDLNRYKIQLLELENSLLERLAHAPADILSDVELVEGVEATKLKAGEIEEAAALGRKTEVEINEAREVYRPVAEEGALLYFLLIQLHAIDHMYQYSLDSFITFFYKAIDKAVRPEDDDVEARLKNLRESLRFTIFTWVSRGLFEEHKLIFLAQLTFELMQRGVIENDFSPQYFDFLLRGPRRYGEDNPLPWLPDTHWAAVQALGELEDFTRFPSDLVEAETRFKEWYNLVSPEAEKLPLEWSALDRTPFLKLLVIRCLRPDRMTIALSSFIRGELPYGDEYVDCDATLSSLEVLAQSLEDSTPATPIFFILSPGTDVVSDVDKLAARYGFEKGATYFNESLGQGQDIIAMERLVMGSKLGHWVMLNNVHLMPAWLPQLEKQLEAKKEEGSHARFRLFLSSDPSPDIPVSLLNRCIMLTNEPPSGLRSNLKRAFRTFDAEEMEEMTSRTRAVLFGLCHFHSVMIERKRFGAKGFNMRYPFNSGDLKSSKIVMSNYMESAGARVPWDDLRYIFGEIMYGGHIVNDYDRLLCQTYLAHFFRDELLEEMELFPFLDGGDGAAGLSFRAPSPAGFERYVAHIDTLTTDSPLAFGLHPNAEIGFRTELCDTLFRSVRELQPRDGSARASGGSPQHVAEALASDMLELLRDTQISMEDVLSLISERGPYTNVFLQECVRMNALVAEIVRSLSELDSGFNGDLTMSEQMEMLMHDLFLDRVPASWARLAYPSQRPLGAWLTDLEQRQEQLRLWTEDPLDIPRVTWLPGLFNPLAFLTAIMQASAGDNELDDLLVQTVVTKRSLEEVEAPSRDGAFIHGLSLEGASWDVASQCVVASRPREMTSPMPVINCRAMLAKSLYRSSVYQCPVYRTQQRGPTFIFEAQLSSRADPARWIMAGVVLVCEAV
eukprot:PLAT3317.22.p1 GENE.PLAT3317.22~~PLAT3317.22.p1  ORF type:complete len:2183 (+),score=1467.98 PLAT3317.22:1402-7950(+)